MTCIIVAQLLTIGVFNFWPAQDQPTENSGEVALNEDVVLIEEAIITEQSSNPPPPPKPRAPVPVPKDEIIEEEIDLFEDINLSEFSDSLSTSKLPGTAGQGEVASSPQQPPSIVRIVEATTPEAAKKANIKAELTVSFLVDQQGNVEEASITRIKLYEGDGSRIVETINYGITEATLNAALQWKFRPARDKGRPVRAYSKQIFTFGF
jgi:outer membrane biosynthesis protein TonB